MRSDAASVARLRERPSPQRSGPGPPPAKKKPAHRCAGFGIGAPYGIRTRVSALRGPCPRPLDEGSDSGCAARRQLPLVTARPCSAHGLLAIRPPLPRQRNGFHGSRVHHRRIPPMPSTPIAVARLRVIPRDAAPHLAQGHQPERAARAVSPARGRLRRLPGRRRGARPAGRRRIRRISTSPPTPRPSRSRRCSATAA